MDDAQHGEYARPPEFEDLLNICRWLNEQSVRYLLIGGFAVILHGYVRATKDIDFLIDPTPENIAKAKKALSRLPDNAIRLIANDEVEKYEVVRIGDEIVIDLMAKACGISFEEAKDEIEWKDVEGLKIPLASKALLIRLKNTVRPSDQADVYFLRSLMEKEDK